MNLFGFIDSMLKWIYDNFLLQPYKAVAIDFASDI